MLIKFSAKARGASHIEKNTPCQDAADARTDRRGTVGMVFVADGHGGGKYFRSQKGSSLAVGVSLMSLFNFFGTMAKNKTAFFDKKAQDLSGHLKQLEGNIIYQWRGAVLEDLAENPLSDDEKKICEANGLACADPSNLIVAYGTTLLAALVCDSFWFVVQIGDGLCVVIENDGSAIAPLPEDGRLAFGRTTSLCDTDAIQNFRDHFGFSKIKGLTVASDGIADSFAPDAYLRFNADLYEKFIRFPEKAETELREFLPELSERGSRDDVAIAGLFRI
jgi:hypothetical protein